MLDPTQSAFCRIDFYGHAAIRGAHSGANRRKPDTTCRGVYTQPDRPKGRGQQVASRRSRRLRCASAAGSISPSESADRRSFSRLAAWRGRTCMVVVGYGQIIPQSIIDLPRHGIVNVHASLLPKYRGAAPIQWAIANGETVTGVTTMLIDAGLDTGDMLLKAETPIGPEETAVELGRSSGGHGSRSVGRDARRNGSRNAAARAAE